MSSYIYQQKNEVLFRKKLNVLLCKHIFPICMHFISALRNSEPQKTHYTLRNCEPVKTVAHKNLRWGCGGSHCIEYIKSTKPLHRVYQRYNENGAPDKKAWRIEVVALGLPSFNHRHRNTLQRQMPPYDQHLGQLHRISQGEIIS